MFEEQIRTAQARVRAAASLEPTFQKPEMEFWQHIVQCCRRAELEMRKPRCKKAGKITYGSEATARVAAQCGYETDVGTRVWNAYACDGCAGWHVGHGWQTKTVALPLEGYAYEERVDLRFSVEDRVAVDVHRYREQLGAALRSLGDYSFDVEGDYTPRCLWPQFVRVRVAPASADAALHLQRVRVGSIVVELGEPRVRAIYPQASLYSRLVTIKGATDERLLGESVGRRIAAWGGSATIEVGQRRVVHVAGFTIVGFEIELSDMDARTSMIVQAQGIGGKGRLGCGLFLPSCDGG